MNIVPVKNKAADDQKLYDNSSSTLRTRSEQAFFSLGAWLSFLSSLEKSKAEGADIGQTADKYVPLWAVDEIATILREHEPSEHRISIEVNIDLTIRIIDMYNAFKTGGASYAASVPACWRIRF